MRWTGDRRETPATVARRLRQLRQIGAFAKINAPLVGRVTPGVGLAATELERMLLETTAPSRFPIGVDFDFGHTDPMFVLPWGPARIARHRRGGPPDAARGGRPVTTGAALIARAEEFARRELAGDSSGHDWWHVDRVRRLALRLAREERADELIVELAALLHDVADYKLSGSEEAGPQAAEVWLRGEGVGEDVVEAVVAIIDGVSFKGADVGDRPLSIEGQCVRDADRLDAMGAIGIARAFAFGGHQGRVLHDPSLAPQRHSDAAAYMNAESTTVNHFYEKLLLLKERMSTDSARRIAEPRHQVMVDFLRELEREWEGRDRN